MMRKMNRDDYNYETDRIEALVLFDEKIYKADQHFEAMLEILEDKGYDREEIYNYDDNKLKLMIGDNVKIAELSTIKKKESLLIYHKEDHKFFKVYYKDLPVYYYQ